MKRNLISLAVMAIVAPAAFADVDVGPISIYGTFATAVEFVKVTTTGATPAPVSGDQTRLQDQTSRLGFKTKLALGDGLDAIGQVESRFYLGNSGDNTDNKAELGTRNTFVGLTKPEYGTLRLGRYDNAYKNSGKQQGSSFGANVNDAASDAGDKQIMGRLGARQGDLISYESASFGGFTANASYNLGRDSTNSISGGAANNTAKNTVATDLMPQFSLGLGYKKDNFSVGFGTTSINNASWELGASSSANAKANTSGTQSLRAYQVGAEYRFGDFQIGAVTETTTSTFNGATLANNYDQSQLTNALVLGYKKDRLEAQFRYAIANDVSGTKGAGNVIGDTGANQFSVGVGYLLHKNAKLIGSYTRVNNGTNASYTSGSGFTLSKGSDLDQLAIGLSVAF